MSEATDNVEAEVEAPEATSETVERPEWLPENLTPLKIW